MTDAEIDELIDDLNSFGRSFDYGYGLPAYDEDAVEQMREIIRHWLRSVEDDS